MASPTADTRGAHAAMIAVRARSMKVGADAVVRGPTPADRMAGRRTAGRRTAKVTAAAPAAVAGDCTPGPVADMPGLARIAVSASGR